MIFLPGEARYCEELWWRQANILQYLNLMISIVFTINLHNFLFEIASNVGPTCLEAEVVKPDIITWERAQEAGSWKREHSSLLRNSDILNWIYINYEQKHLWIFIIIDTIWTFRDKKPIFRWFLLVNCEKIENTLQFEKVSIE